MAKRMCRAVARRLNFDGLDMVYFMMVLICNYADFLVKQSLILHKYIEMQENILLIYGKP